ncbi:trafficking protein particle complex 2 [Moesziomyces antarcticus]|uniref:Trafficking protein particle complex subunit 2-like protein n=2 Tax=Pseudozyma antarctica TaxID=84753 RepID=A0A081CF71_PSEA2|nr:trafficking protein particle complex 2 [Moesziomyces antarcticus]GAK65317.1 trafficking protein particle complex 2 [Moesziomyces antarcticus]SPO46322.1 uncharacterized protein PSANT_04008 [Moesziomyces antarcticus]
MSTSAPRIQALAIVSPRGGPIYVRQFGRSPSSSTAADLRYHYFAHAALDVMDERTALAVAPGASSNRTSSEQYLGLLSTLEDLAIYGFQTCAKLRILLMLSLTDHAVRDIDMLTLFRAVYTACLKYSANPFHSLPPTTFARAAGSDIDGKDDQEAVVAQEELEKRQASNLPINCRPIRSSAFDARIDRIVFGSASAAGAPRESGSAPRPTAATAAR